MDEVLGCHSTMPQLGGGGGLDIDFVGVHFWGAFAEQMCVLSIHTVLPVSVRELWGRGVCAPIFGNRVSK